MKAKVIKTGEIVNVVPTEGGWVADFGNSIRHYADSELDFEFADWDKFRREAAKDILCSLLSRVERIYTCVKSDGSRVTDHRDFIRVVIEDADELIKQLREGEK